MAKLASDEYLVVLRYQEYQLPITTEALEKYISRLLDTRFQKYNLDPIPVALWMIPPTHQDKSYGWFSFLREEKRAIAISFNLQKFDGLTISEVEDTVLHELCHYLVFQRFPDLKEGNNGHGTVFYDTCREMGCKPEAGSTHRKIRRVWQRRIDHQLTSSKRAFLSGDLAKANSIAFDESLYGVVEENLPFEAFLNYYRGDITGLLVCLDDLRDYIEDDMQAEAIFAYLSMKVCKDDEAWQYLMHLKNATSRSVLAQYFYGKILIEGSYGISPSIKTGLRYLERAMRFHFEPALRLWKETMLKIDDCPSMRKMAELIDSDIKECSMDVVSGEDCTCFVPFI